MLSALDKETLQQALHRFEHWSPTQLTTHPDNALCCRAAQLWFHAMDSEHHAQRPDGTTQRVQPPVWIQQHFQWGAAPLRLMWCDTMQRETLDCGVLAALAYASFVQQGADTVRVQAVMRYAPTVINQWRERWQAQACSTEWIHAPYVYHEMVGIVENNQLRLYDPSESVWVDSGFTSANGGIVALHVVSLPDDGRSLCWGETQVIVNQWHSLLR